MKELQVDLENIRTKYQSIESCLIELGIQYTSKPNHAKVDGHAVLFFTPSFFKEKTIFEIRDSIFSKLNSVYYHLRILIQLQEIDERKLKQSLLDERERHNLLTLAIDKQLFLVEDIIIHLKSVFDYLGNLTGYIFYGSQRMKLKWKGVMRCYSNPKWEKEKMGNTKINESISARLMSSYEKTLVEKLEDYRAHLFHYMTDTSGGKLSVNIFALDKSSLTIKPPKLLLKYLKEVLDDKINDDSTLIEVVNNLTEKCFDATLAIIAELRNDIERECIIESQQRKNNSFLGK